MHGSHVRDGLPKHPFTLISVKSHPLFDSAEPISGTEAGGYDRSLPNQALIDAPAFHQIKYDRFGTGGKQA